MFLNQLFTIVLSLFVEVVADDLFRLAKTRYGTVRGKIDKNGSVPVVKYLGIQYGTPPTGQLRFIAPQRPGRWDGVRDALAFGPECPQTDLQGYPFGSPRSNRSEDCLYLNVYTPSKDSVQHGHGAPLTVMVWIHGGGYYVGAASHFDFTALAARGVVVVTINYRLDLLGFLSTGDDIIPGNYGMLDQVLALRWVKGNIAEFGGDPQQVTIFGVSAGASSVSLLILSPLAKGLFQRAIAESGSSMSPWALEFPGNKMSDITSSRLIAEAAGCNVNDESIDLLHCLQSVDIDILLNISAKISIASEVWALLCPRVETVHGFLPDAPLKLLSRGEFNKVDVIYGFNHHEDGSVVDMVFKTASIQDSIKFHLKILPELSQDQLLAFLKPLYIDKAQGLHEPSASLVRMAGDILFTGPILHELSKHTMFATNKTQYLYRFDHRPSFSTMPDWVSAVHGDEVRFVMDIRHRQDYDANFRPSADDVIVSEQMLELWTSFARTGVPAAVSGGKTVTWEPFDPVRMRYLQINRTSSVGFWNRDEPIKTFNEVMKKLQG